jgi:hypothetical protein
MRRERYRIDNQGFTLPPADGMIQQGRRIIRTNTEFGDIGACLSLWPGRQLLHRRDESGPHATAGNCECAKARNQRGDDADDGRAVYPVLSKPIV